MTNKQEEIEIVTQEDNSGDFYLWLIQPDFIDISLVATLTSLMPSSLRDQYINQQMDYQKKIL